MKKKIGAIICFMLVLSITSSIVSGQNISVKNEKNKIKKENNPPSTPTIFAPDKVIKNKVFVLKVISNDPDEDKIYYRFKIGKKGKASNWIGAFESGFEEKLRVRILFYTGNLTFGAQAKDENGATSDWSYHKVTYINAHSHNILGNTLLCFLHRLLHIII